MEDGEGPHKITISREYSTPDEERLLSRAEAVYAKREDRAARFFKNWRYLAESYFALPRGEPGWWNTTSNPILATEVVTTSAVLYYYNLSPLLRSNGDKVKENSFAFRSTELKYEASIKRLASYSRSGKSFKDVYVANMTLPWGQVCGNLCGSGFTRNKIVVLRTDSEILDMFVDDPQNNSSWIS